MPDDNTDNQEQQDSTEQQSDQPSPDSQKQDAGPIELPADHPLVRTLESQKQTIQELKETKKQFDKLAEVFGPQGDDDNDDIASRLSERMDAIEHKSTFLDVCDEYNIPKEYRDLLTARDRDGLAKQAEKVAALVGNADKTNEPNGLPYSTTAGQYPAQPPDTRTQVAAAESEGDRDRAFGLKMQQLQEQHDKKR